MAVSIHDDDISEYLYDCFQSLVLKEVVLDFYREIKTERIAMEFSTNIHEEQEKLDRKNHKKTSTVNKNVPSTPSSWHNPDAKRKKTALGSTSLEVAIVDCVHCGQRVSVVRFAAHLDKCMSGQGRSSLGTKIRGCTLENHSQSSGSV